MILPSLTLQIWIHEYSGDLNAIIFVGIGIWIHIPISDISEDNVPPQKQTLCEDSPLQLNVTACGQSP